MAVFLQKKVKNRVDNVDKYVDKRENVEITGQKLRLPAKAAGDFFLLDRRIYI